MRFRAALVLGWLALAGGALADARSEAVARLQARYEATRTMRASFHQRVESPTLAAPLESRGTVLFERPNHMRWDYAPPDEQLIVGDGKTLWIYQPDLKQAIRTPLREAFEAQTPLTFLAGLGQVERDFDTTLEREDDRHWVLRLVPKGDAHLGTLVLVVRKSDAGLAEARITDPVGTTTSLTFSDEARNVEIPPDRFRFEPPPGVDVVGPPTY
ncbi:MAG TPA: outer membrane lipoprotein chaperone LolA [Candidatus Limnocylindria bacterium]|nr:outer membrane lipoprotein chaperone LolA [Candidatus Limnocylindria bacterium]